VSRAGLLAALAAVLCGCGRQAAGAASAAVRDSAGVRVVEVRGEAAALDRRWSLGLAPELTVGAPGAEPQVELFGVVGAHRLGDGSLLIANSGTGELLRVSAGGRIVRRYGRKGRGPGEFVSLAGLWPGRGDTAYAYDMDLARVTPFTPEAGFGSPVSTPAGNAAGLVVLRGRMNDGAYLGVVVKGFSGAAERPGVHSDSMAVVRVARGSTATLAHLLFGRSFVRASGGTTMATAIPFEAAGVAAPWAGGYYLGETGRYELRRYDPDGRLRAVIRRRMTPARVGAADLDRVVAAWTESGRTDEASARRTLGEMPIPRRFPAFARAVAAADGGVWVQDGPAGDPSAPVAWTWFASDGRIAGRIALDPSARLLEAAAGRLVTVATDGEGVERVTVYRVAPRTARGAPRGP